MMFSILLCVYLLPVDPFLCTWNVCICLSPVFWLDCVFVFSYCWILRVLKYVLDTTPVLDMWFAVIIFQSVVCLSRSQSFAEQKFLPFFFFVFNSCTCGMWKFLGWRLRAVAEVYATATATLDLSLFCDLCRRLWQHQILNPLSEARDQTCILTETVSGP